MRENCIILFCLFLAVASAAQNHEAQYWTRYASNIEFTNIQINASIEDRVAVEGLTRRSLLANAVLLYKIGDNYTIGAGFAHFTTYDEEKNGLAIPELRPFLQLGASHDAGKFGFDHRFRIEQRFQRDTLGEVRLNSYSYTFRARYRFELTYSLVKKQKQQGNFGIQLKDEIMISAVNINENFDQNRLYVGFIYQMSKSAALELGYMSVDRNAIGDPDQNSDVVRLTFRHDVDFK